MCRARRPPSGGDVVSRRRNPHGREALAAAELRARTATRRRRIADAAKQNAADVADRRNRIEQARTRSAIFAHLRGPRLLARNVPVRLGALLAGTNENEADYERWL